MPYIHHIPFLSIFVPILAGILTAVIRSARWARRAFLVASSLSLGASLVLLVYFLQSGTQSFVYNLGIHGSPWVNTLFASPAEVMMAISFLLVLVLSCIAGKEEILSDIQDRHQYLYYLFLNLLIGSLLVLVYTNDIFTAYVFVEINTIAACMIIILHEKGSSLVATLKYFVMAAVGSGFFLFSIAMLYGVTGHLAMDALFPAIQDLYASGQYQVPLLVSLVLFFVSLAIKSALFPFHSWLPDAHSSATPASSAILSGVVLKGYILIFMKILMRVYGLDIVSHFNIWPVIYGFGIISMLVASFLALLQKDIKKMIAYSTVAQIGYIYAAIGLGTPISFVVALFHIMGHAVTKAVLFLAAGKAIQKTGIRQVSQYDGFARVLPLAMLAFAIAGLSMIGIPPSAGFSSKWNLAIVSLEGSHYSMLIFLTLSALLNIAYYLPIILRAFINPPTDEVLAVSQHTPSVSKTSMAALMTLTLMIILLGLFTGSIMDILNQGITSWQGGLP